MIAKVFLIELKKRFFITRLLKLDFTRDCLRLGHKEKKSFLSILSFLNSNLILSSSVILLSFSCNSFAFGLSDMDLLFNSSASLLFPDLYSIPISFAILLDSFNIESYLD